MLGYSSGGVCELAHPVQFMLTIKPQNPCHCLVTVISQLAGLISSKAIAARRSSAARSRNDINNSGKDQHMNQVKIWVGVVTLLCASQMGGKAQYALQERAFNIDGIVYDVPFGTPPIDPAGANPAGFDTATGLGSLNYSIGAGNAGAHYVAAFFDHDIDAAINTFFNEVGSVAGAPLAGQSWEVDEPGYTVGDIYANLTAGTLDNSVGLATPDDVSMAIGWSFLMGPTDKATIAWTLSITPPTGTFYLTQTDPDSSKTIYFTSSLRVTPVGAPEVSSTLALLVIGLVAVGGLRACFKIA